MQLDDTATIGTALAATTALSTAAFGLLDATKVFNGGPSNIGKNTVKNALLPFASALDEAVGPGKWWPIVRAGWIGGVAKTDQKARVQAIIRLGLTPRTADAVATATHVEAAALIGATTRLEDGTALTEADLAVLGRMNAVIDLVLDGAFERADQLYRNWSRGLAGTIAVVLSLVARDMWSGDKPPSLLLAAAVGFLAVPLAPIAKDLTSALSAASRALKAAKQL